MATSDSGGRGMVRLNHDQERRVGAMLDDRTADQIKTRLRLFTVARFRTMRSLYAELDVDKDGKVQRSEFVTGLPQCGFPITENEARLLYDQAVPENKHHHQQQQRPHQRHPRQQPQSESFIDYSSFCTIFDPPPLGKKCLVELAQRARARRPSGGHDDAADSSLLRGRSVTTSSNEPYGGAQQPPHRHHVQHLPVDQKRADMVKTVVRDRVLNQQGGGSVMAHQQQLKMLRAFRTFDSAQLGMITFANFREVVGLRGLNLGLSRDEVEDLIRVCDSDKNGAISYKEFVSALTAVKGCGGGILLDGQERSLARMRQQLLRAEPPQPTPIRDPEPLQDPGGYHCFQLRQHLPSTPFTTDPPRSQPSHQPRQRQQSPSPDADAVAATRSALAAAELSLKARRSSAARVHGCDFMVPAATRRSPLHNDDAKFGLDKTDHLTLPHEHTSLYGSPYVRFDLSDKGPQGGAGAGAGRVRVEDADWHDHARERRRNRGKNRLKREILVNNSYQEEADAQALKDYDRIRCKAERALQYMQGSFQEGTKSAAVAPAQGIMHAYSPYKVTQLW